MSDTDATRERYDGACSDEILRYLDGEWDRDSFEYYVYSDLYDMASEILDENAGLRELVRDMWNWLAPTAMGGGAPLKGLYERMRKMGVEL